MDVGTVVWLKSGGPAMTITDSLPGRVKSCDYFDGVPLHYRKQFHEDSLTTTKPDWE